MTGAIVRILPRPGVRKDLRDAAARSTANVRETTQTYLSFFAQDTFKIGSRLTLRPGLRWEQQELTGVGGGYTFTDNWSPRIGATFDPTGSGRSKIFANFGRFYTQFPNDLAARGFTALASHQADYFDAALTRPIPDGVLAAGTTIHYRPSGANPAQVIPGSKSTYIQEWLAGARIRVVSRASTSASATSTATSATSWRTSRPRPWSSTTSGIARGIVFTIGNPATASRPPSTTSAPSRRSIHRYDAVELSADRALRRPLGVAGVLPLVAAVRRLTRASTGTTTTSPTRA